MNFTENQFNITIPISNIVIQSFSTLIETVIEFSIGFIFVVFKILSLEHSIILSKTLSIVTAYVLFPFFLLDKFSRTINLDILQKSWLLLILGVVQIFFSHIFSYLFYFISSKIVFFCRFLILKLKDILKVETNEKQPFIRVEPLVSMGKNF